MPIAYHYVPAGGTSLSVNSDLCHGPLCGIMASFNRKAISHNRILSVQTRYGPLGHFLTIDSDDRAKQISMMVSSFLTSHIPPKSHRLSQVTTTLLLGLGLQHWVLGLKNSDLVLENQFFSHISLHISFPTFLFHESGKNWFRLMGRFK